MRSGGAGIETAVGDVDNDGKNEIVALSIGDGVAKDGKLSWVSIIKPVVEHGVITGFVRLPDAFSSVSQEEGDRYWIAHYLSIGEFDNCPMDGDEIVFSMINLNHYQPGSDATNNNLEAKFIIVKIIDQENHLTPKVIYDSNVISGLPNHIVPYFSAFQQY